MVRKIFLVLVIAAMAALIIQFAGIPSIVKGQIADDGEVSQLPRTMDETISDFIEQNTKATHPNGKVFESHKLYGTIEKNGIIYAYIWSYTGEYVKDGENLKQGRVQNLPFTVALQKGTQGEYIPLVAFEYTPDKSDNEKPENQKIAFPDAFSVPGGKLDNSCLSFPQKFHNQVKGTVGFDALKEIVKQKAFYYFNIMPDDSSEANMPVQETQIPSQSPDSSSGDTSPAATDPASSTSPAVTPAPGDSTGDDDNGDDDNVIIRTDSGKYIGRIDNNSIEVRISGVQNEAHAYKAFRLSEDMKTRFDNSEFNEGDMVLMTYYVNEHNQNILKTIVKIKN